MDRRSLIGLMAGCFLGFSPAIRAQPAKKVYRIGSLTNGEPVATVFWDTMRAFGWLEGRDIVIESRYAVAEEQLPALAAELVRSKPDLILTDSTPASLAAKRASTTIPIVFIVGADPVASGLVSSLARPGGNVTGFAHGLYREKMLETLVAAVPSASCVAIPTGPREPISEYRHAAKELGVELLGIETVGLDAMAGFFESAQKTGADAVLIPNIAGLGPWMLRLGSDAARAGLPAIAPFRHFAVGGGLLAYGPTYNQAWSRMALQVAKILRGAKPADIPVERPTTFTTVINLKTAKALGIWLPQWLLLGADEIIER